jgi:hypothetical protein
MSKLPLIGFSILLIFGFLIGSAAAQSRRQQPDTAMEESPASSKLAAPQNNPLPTKAQREQAPKQQQNILVIGVDSTEVSTPRLESAWLALYIPDYPGLTLLALYPSVGETGEEQNAFFTNNFLLDERGGPAPSFTAALKEKDLWWDHYVLLDESGLANLIGLANGTQMGVDNSSNVRMVTGMPQAWEDPQAALASQVALVSSLCGMQQQITNSASASGVFQVMGSHMRTDMTLTQVASDWKLMAKVSGQPCKFPLKNQALDLIALK